MLAILNHGASHDHRKSCVIGRAADRSLQHVQVDWPLGQCFLLLPPKTALRLQSCWYTRFQGTCSSSRCTSGLTKGSVTRFKDVTVNSVEAQSPWLSSLFQSPSKLASFCPGQFYFGDGVMQLSVFAVGCGFDGSTNCCGRPKRV